MGHPSEIYMLDASANISYGILPCDDEDGEEEEVRLVVTMPDGQVITIRATVLTLALMASEVIVIPPEEADL